MRKIIHIDMDCFYAAIEEREDPSLVGKPVAVAGSGRRSVLTTANYEARKYGCRSAMPLYRALEMCPQLVVVPVRYEFYAGVSAGIRSIFGRFSERIEPLSLDEAYLDVSHLRSSGGVIAKEIRHQIREEYGLTASAGISVNKLLAKMASELNKPNGQYEIRAEDIESFMAEQPVGRLWGVGSKTKELLEEMGVKTCGDLQRYEKVELAQRFGKWGVVLWELCRGIDEREVEVDRVRKSVSRETTFEHDLTQYEELRANLFGMVKELQDELLQNYHDRKIRSLVVKIKLSDFQRVGVERARVAMEVGSYEEMLREVWQRVGGKAVRLLGVGVKLEEPKEDPQMEFF